MTNDCLKTLKTRLILGLTVICLIFSCLFGFTACNDEEEISEPTYSFTATTEDNGDVKNATFAIDSDKTKDDAFPITSATGWTKAVDNSAASSAVNSGIVKVTDDSWKSTVKTLYSDSDFADYIEKQFDKDKDAIKEAIKTDKGGDYSATDEDVADYVATNYFKNPGKRDGGDDYVYMLNNYRAKENYNLGTAQKLTSSSTLTLEKGKSYKITVWVKTLNLTENGANIRITNSFGGVSQAEAAIDGINNTDWTQYTLYVKASKDYDCSATLVLGLGYGNGGDDYAKDYTEGTVYFDDVEFSEVTDETTVPVATTSNTLEFGKTDRKTLTATSENVYVYDMNANLGTTALSTTTLIVSDNLTKSNVKNSDKSYTHGTYTFSNESGEYVATLDKSSVTLSLTSTAFTVANESYFYLSFYIKNSLNKFGSTDFTVDVWDIHATGEKVKRAAIYTSSDACGEWEKIEIIVKNNFTSVSGKTFSVDLVIGPAVVSPDVNDADYASGEVRFKDFTYKTGKTDKDAYKDIPTTGSYKDGTDNPAYKIYNSLFTAKASATVALYAGNAADYTESTETESYSLTYAPGDIGSIETKAADVNGYYGVTPNHEYIKDDGTETKTNVRSGKGNDDGIAGLINTKYLDKYADVANLGITDIATQIGDYGDDDIQAIMIYNKTANHYGFIGTSQTISASAYAKISVTLKVNGDAKAYVYLTDLISGEVMSFEDFTVNTDAIGKNGEKIEGKKLSFEKIGKTDGWKTLTFYVAAGATEKNFRVEVWNGGRDGAETTASQGFVFVKDITVTTSSAFTEPSRYADAFTSTDSPLYGVNPDNAETAAYVRELTSTEKAFNKEYPDQAVSYGATFVWAKTDDICYAIYNTLDPVETDPYESISDDEEETSGCAAETDPSTFWLSFSSILLGVVLVLAILALILKTVHRRRVANKNDAKSQYKVKSRIDTHKENQKRAAKSAKATETETDEIEEAIPEETEPAEKQATEQNLDDYVYGDVQNFGDAETNEDKPEEESSSDENKTE